ncbi:HpcH/HpaI aldolase/citrate lyase family protein [Streptomyces aurantiacus]|uniref:Citryl-CoA lyase n=1 Tax=Streptomyces aurantiacus TaxID=47760 RepID=A0A7G1PFV6_9ACTN|nr:CoA ester lyase [Streptomyces aurantiacus]BCL32646.1 citryl-CoA lyase [Streptomyces aurantiacus]
MDTHASPLAAIVATARTFLFVPGHRPDRFDKAAAGTADVVIVDLEDSVAPDLKRQARDHAAAWLGQGRRHRAMVRINGVGTPWYEDDLAVVAGLTDVVMVPKAQAPEDLVALSRRLPGNSGIVPLIETAGGILRAPDVCAVASVIRPAFGSVDLATQLGVDHRSYDALHHARSALVLAAAAAGCAAPVDGVTTSVEDEALLSADVEHAAALGYTGKLCIHPRQVDVADRGFTPSEREVSWAHGVIAAAAGGSVAVHEGQMIDRPVVLRARAVLARACGSRPAHQTDTGPA